LIAVDWGTSNFRTFKLDADGNILARRFLPKGILRVESGHFSDTLRTEVEDWLAEGERHILLCAMIGSREGWMEAPYLSCPVGIDDLAGSVMEVPFAGADVRLVPGVAGTDLDGVPEVMRGEETEAMGILEACGGEGLVCFPGTHSKWIHLSNGKIVNFVTCMTGELYGALSKNTILERTMTKGRAVDEAAFRRGIARSAESGGLLHHLFGVRTLTLTEQLSEDVSASYLSGLLIGHEVRAAIPSGSTVHLVGAAPLCALYAQAIEACGGSATIEDEDAAARGLAAIARRLTWS
jgi:2-dehydro-3-deoxygalactonokinase